MQLLDQHAGNTTPEQLGMLVMSTVAPSTKWNSSAIPMCYCNSAGLEGEE